MTTAEKRIQEEACRLARKSGRFLPTSNDLVKAQMSVLSGSKKEVRSMADEVEAYNRARNNG